MAYFIECFFCKNSERVKTVESILNTPLALVLCPRYTRCTVLDQFKLITKTPKPGRCRRFNVFIANFEYFGILLYFWLWTILWLPGVYLMTILMILMSSYGLSFLGYVLTVLICWQISIPLMTRPKTVCLLSSHGWNKIKSF